jgi:hypothetical protein
MTPLLRDELDRPLNPRQLAFARELGIAIARGDRNFSKAYAAAGYKPERGNARRLAVDPRVRKIADEACRDALERTGLKIEYLQAKALVLLHASVTELLREIGRCLERDEKTGTVRLKMGLSDEEKRAVDAATWPLCELKIDKDGVVAIRLPDKKSIIEMLSKQLGVGSDTSVNVDLTLENLIAASYQTHADKGNGEELGASAK